MMTFYYKEGSKVKHITLNVEEYTEMNKRTKLYNTEKEAKRG